MSAMDFSLILCIAGALLLSVGNFLPGSRKKVMRVIGGIMIAIGVIISVFTMVTALML
jgi:cytochrome c biogenesis protein CcdA